MNEIAPVDANADNAAIALMLRAAATHMTPMGAALLELAAERLSPAAGAIRPLQRAPLIRRDFDIAFRTACRKNGARAAYVLADPRPAANGGSRLVLGGDMTIATAIQSALNALVPGSAE